MIEKLLRNFVFIQSCVLLTACGESPSFQHAVNSYQENTSLFSELANYSCQMGKSGKLNYYRMNDDKYAPIEKIDNILDKLRAKELGYSKNSEGKCSLEVVFHRYGFAGSGQYYAYRYQIVSPAPYDEELHSSKYTALKKGEDVIFDRPLYKNSNFKGWYLTFKNN